jgi:hypothetical protein
LSAEDAAVIARSTALLDATDFQQLGPYEVYAALMADNAAQPFCSATTRPLPAASGNAARVRQLSRNTFGVTRQAIDEELRALVGDARSGASGSIGSRRRADPDGGRS